MKTNTCFKAIVVGMLLAGMAAVAADSSSRQMYREALYLESGAGDPAGALALYEQAAEDPSVGIGLVLEARRRSAQCLDRLGRRSEAAECLSDVMTVARDKGTEETQAIGEAAACDLWRMAEAERTDRGGQTAQARDWAAAVQSCFPQVVEQMVLERAVLRRTLRGHIEAWDGGQPTRAGVRIRARPVSPGEVKTQSTWRTQTDEEGHFAIELPIGRYEVRVWAPSYDRVYATTILTPEEELPPEMSFVLPRIRLPARIEQVNLVGNFLDEWEGMRPLDLVAPGVWETQCRLGPGHYEYKFGINGGEHLITDVAAKAFTADAHDGFNAVLDLDREEEIRFRFDEHDPHFRREGETH